jgi:hypothetical protein
MASLAVLAMAGSSAHAVQPARHTVTWYRTHARAREEMLGLCQNDHIYDNQADCRNALSAAHGAIADSLELSESQDPEATVAYYGHNGPLIAMTLSLCSRHQAPTAWCQAAQAASANLNR